jgi:hypothetical protein
MISREGSKKKKKEGLSWLPYPKFRSEKLERRIFSIGNGFRA